MDSVRLRLGGVGNVDWIFGFWCPELVFRGFTHTNYLLSLDGKLLIEDFLAF